MQVREWAAEAKFQPKIDNIGPIRGTIQTSPAVSKLSSYQDEKETMSFFFDKFGHRVTNWVNSYFLAGQVISRRSDMIFIL